MCCELRSPHYGLVSVAVSMLVHSRLRPATKAPCRQIERLSGGSHRDKQERLGRGPRRPSRLPNRSRSNSSMIVSAAVVVPSTLVASGPVTRNRAACHDSRKARPVRHAVSGKNGDRASALKCEWVASVPWPEESSPKVPHWVSSKDR